MCFKGIIPDFDINKTHPYSEFVRKPRNGFAITKFKPTKDMIGKEINSMLTTARHSQFTTQ